jgi:hypothetical protein
MFCLLRSTEEAVFAVIVVVCDLSSAHMTTSLTPDQLEIHPQSPAEQHCFGMAQRSQR